MRRVELELARKQKGLNITLKRNLVITYHRRRRDSGKLNELHSFLMDRIKGVYCNRMDFMCTSTTELIKQNIQFDAWPAMNRVYFIA